MRLAGWLAVWLAACLPACPPARLPGRLTCLPACLPACLPGCLAAWPHGLGPRQPSGRKQRPCAPTVPLEPQAAAGSIASSARETSTPPNACLEPPPAAPQCRCARARAHARTSSARALRGQRALELLLSTSRGRHLGFADDLP